MDSANLIKQVIEPYKETLIKNLVVWFTLILTIILTYIWVNNTEQISQIQGFLIGITIIGFIYFYLNIVALDKEIKKTSIGTTIFIVFLSVAYWMQQLYGNVQYYFLITTIVYASVIMYVKRDFLGRSMALVEQEVFGEPLTKKWRQKLKNEKRK